MGHLRRMTRLPFVLVACRPAPACQALRDQATGAWPDRSQASDGICASSQHHAENPTSDHEPDVRGIAHAVDLTHDPVHGCDVDVIFDEIVARRDPRVKYLIRDRRIVRSYKTTPQHPEPWTWDAYHGVNPHTKHGHVSVWTEHENDTSPWFEEDDMPWSDTDSANLAKLVDLMESVNHQLAGDARLKAIAADVDRIADKLVKPD